MALTATHVRVATVDEIMNDVSGNHAQTSEDEAPESVQSSTNSVTVPSWFERCFSNEWQRLQTAIDAQLDAIATNQAIQAFFNDRDVNDMSFDLLCSITISNRTLLPGMLAFTFRRPPPEPATLTLDYLITNSAEIIVPVDTPQVK
jgi:hypothetical protein